MRRKDLNLYKNSRNPYSISSKAAEEMEHSIRSRTRDQKRNPDNRRTGDLNKSDKRDVGRPEVLVLASVASMIDQFNMPNIRLLQNMGYAVHVACNFMEGNTCDAIRIGKLREKLRKLHVTQHQWDCPRDIHPFGRCARAYRQLCYILERNHFAWIHCHSPIGGMLARAAANQRHIRVIYTAHGFHFYRGAPLKNWLLYYPAEKWMAYWTDVLITVNQEDYRFAKKRLQAGSIYYTPGIGINLGDFDRLQSFRRAENDGKQQFHRAFCIPENVQVLLSVGELNAEKNHRMVLEAMAALTRQDVYYLICGQGSMKDGLLEYAERLGISDRIRMPGYQEDMPWIYQYADIFVFPSKREGMPVALMEAMAAGMPCVVSDIRGNRELIGPALRFSLNRTGQLAHLLEMLLDDEKRRYQCGMKNRKKMQHYGQGEVEIRMRDIYGKMQGLENA